MFQFFKPKRADELAQLLKARLRKSGDPTDYLIKFEQKYNCRVMKLGDDSDEMEQYYGRDGVIVTSTWQVLDSYGMCFTFTVNEHCI